MQTGNLSFLAHFIYDIESEINYILQLNFYFVDSQENDSHNMKILFRWHILLTRFYFHLRILV